MQVQDELNIIVRKHEQQLALIKSYNIFLREVTSTTAQQTRHRDSELDPSFSHVTESATSLINLLMTQLCGSPGFTRQQHCVGQPYDPIGQQST